MTPPIPQGPKEVDAEAVLTPETLKADIREFMDMLKWHGGAEEVTQRRLVLDARRKVIKHADTWAEQLRQQTERADEADVRIDYLIHTHANYDEDGDYTFPDGTVFHEPGGNQAELDGGLASPGA